MRFSKLHSTALEKPGAKLWLNTEFAEANFLKEPLGHLMYSARKFKTATCPRVVTLSARRVSEPAFFTAFLSAFLLLLF